MEIELKDLVGEHVLDTAAIISFLPPDHEGGGEKTSVSFGMDGQTYTAIEDPDDGYRSFLSKVQVEDCQSRSLKGASLVGRNVVATHKDTFSDDCSDFACDILTITDAETDHVWLVLGTENTDDYYPLCVITWRAMPPANSNGTHGRTE